MATKLLIVESPTKAKKIAPMLGRDWDVLASVGHVRDLPKMGMNVERSGAYAMTYEVIAGKGDVVKRLRTAARAVGKEVYLATDPDREGESIAWHLEVLLGLRNPYRVSLHELTAPAVKAAIAKPGRIDRDLVAAQETRRALDRLYGYDVSSALSRKLGGKRSAGRVQTIGLRLIVDREREIDAFVSRAHHTVVLTLRGATPWTAEWAFKPLLPTKDETLWTDTTFADRVAAIRDVRVAACESGEARSAPPPPFTTSTMTQVASKRLKSSPKKTMTTAQALFDAGVITYHRTDDPNLSDKAAADIREWATAHGLPLHPTKRTWKAKAMAQGAHEAIRPTDVSNEAPNGLTADQQALYALIRLRAITSQLADAVFDVRTVTLDGGHLDDKPIVFLARGLTLRIHGWKAFAPSVKGAAAKGEPDVSNPVPVLAVGAKPVVVSGKRLDKNTEPPPRYDEASLVKKLEDSGVGRPSTYDSIVETIQVRGYVTLDPERRFRPLVPGLEIIDALRGAFAFVELDYTKRLEEQLDDIADGKATYLDVVRTADTALLADLAKFGPPGYASFGPRPPITEGPRCPKCGQAKLRLRKGGFWGCGTYPTCNATFNDLNGKPILPPKQPARRA